MVAAVLLGAFGTPTPMRALVRLPAAALLAGLALVLLGEGIRHAGALASLYLAVAFAASGLARLGRSLGLPDVTAGGLAALVLWTAMAGLFWADPAGELLPRSERRALKQAVLHADPALALAYDGVGFDRLRAPEVYFEVPLASSLYERPRWDSTGGRWILTGALAWLLAWGISVRRRRWAARRATGRGPLSEP